MEIHKGLVRQLIWNIFGRSITEIEAIPVLSGPLKGRVLPKQSAFEQLSVLFGHYEPAVVSEVLRISEATKIIYDVGANVGYITLAFAHRMKNGGKIFAFEPLPSNIESLRKLIRINGLEAHVEVLPLAVADKTGQQKFVMWGSSAMHLLESALNGQDTSSCSSIVVGSATLDSFVFDLKNPPPHLIKIDVEGAEALVLEGAFQILTTYSPDILMEIHGTESALRVWDILDRFDYKWLRLTVKERVHIRAKGELLSYFNKDAWTHHFVLTKENDRIPIQN